MRFTVESAGGVASKARMGRHEITFDQPASLGGNSTGPGPLVVFAVSAAACAHYYAAAFLQQRGIDVSELKVDVETTKASEGPNRLAQLEFFVQLPPGVPEKYLSAIHRAVEMCPVHGTLAHSPEMTVTLSRPEDGAEQGADHAHL